MVTIGYQMKRRANVCYVVAKKGQPKPWRVRWLPDSETKYQTKFFITKEDAIHHANAINTKMYGLQDGFYDSANQITHKQINNLIQHFLANGSGQEFDEFYIQPKRKYKLASIFSCGGLDMFYAPNDGGDVVLGLEKVGIRAEFFKKIHTQAEVIHGELAKKITNIERLYARRACHIEIDCLIATPPCQAASRQAHQRNDSLNDLIVPTMRLFNTIRPPNFLIENIPLYPKQKIHYRGRDISIQDFIKSKVPDEYSLRFTQLDAQDYSTPQRRKTWFALMSKNGEWEDPIAHPQKVTVAQVIGDQSIFPVIEAGERSPVPLHEAPNTSSHIIDRVKGLKPKQSISSHRKTSYMRENKDEPANKQTTNYNASGTSNLHYEQNRVKSLRERFALSGLPAHLCDFLDKGHGQSFKQRYGYPRQFFSDITGEMLAPKLLLALLETMPIATHSV